MEHGILSVKLCQLDKQIGRLHSLICMSELSGQDQLRQEICSLERECEISESSLRENLHHSKPDIVSVLSRAYDCSGKIAQSTKEELQAMDAASPDAQTAAEGRILLAEYALDFAYQAAQRALLLSLKAIEAQQLAQKEGSHT